MQCHCLLINKQNIVKKDLEMTKMLTGHGSNQFNGGISDSN